MPDFFTLDYHGAPFVLLSRAHLLALAGVLLVNVLIVLVLRARPGLQASMRYLLIGFCLLNQLAWDAWQLAVGIWSPTYSLPLHICTLSVLLAAIMLFTRSYTLYQVLYFWGFAGATNAMLTPDIQSYGFPHFRFWIFFTSHGAILAAVVFATVAYRYRPHWRSIGVVFVATNLLMIPIGIVNWLTGGNYMYLARTPEFASLISYLGPWPWYIVSLECIAMVAFVLCYLPFALRDWLHSGRRRVAPVS